MGVASQFAALPMESLIGGPLNAAATAQGTLAGITTKFITEVGLQDDGNGNLSARTVDFQYDKPFKTSTTDAAGKVTDTWDKVSLNLKVPLLTIVKAPNLQVKEVNVTFDMSVSTSDSSSNTNSQSATVSASWKGWGAKVKFQGSVSNKNESQRKSDTSAKYHIDVKAIDEGAPEGLMKVLDILGEAIQPAE
jgi:hypothetical protein|tara:strand:- start:2406 stop:2981 length:576 start_codon:yes stop_codon:yes gene_type:complete